MFFAGAERPSVRDPYALVRDAARFADTHGFCAVWTPERHFHEFGGQFPNPSVLSAALASITSRVQLRAGSVITPLHDPIRIAEEWALVDNLSGGRAAISCGAGWNANDFVLQPTAYSDRHARMYEDIELMRQLWRGETVTRTNGAGASITVRIHPRPIQPELPLWVTSSGNVETFISAGRIGAHLLTHLLGQEVEALAAKIRAYRRARAESDLDPDGGRVAVMLHAFLGTDLAAAERVVKPPFVRYLESSIRLEAQAAEGGGAISGGHHIAPHPIAAATMRELLESRFARYFPAASLLGTIETARSVVDRLEACGVDEIACLIDFGPSDEEVLSSLERLDQLRAECGAPSRLSREEAAVRGFTGAIS